MERLPPARGSESLLALGVQAVPLFVWVPLRRLAGWVVFAWLLVCLGDRMGTGRLEILLLSLLLARALAQAVLPLVGIAGKWVLVGRYREGRYPLWGQYYLRWWLVDQLLMVCGKGIFGLHAGLLRLYYVLLGARIAPGAVIHAKAELGEFDLITIGPDVKIDDVPVRAFCFEAGGMALRRVDIGAGAAVCSKAVLIPGVPVPPGAVIGPLSSSYDLASEKTPDREERAADMRACCGGDFPKPCAILCVAGWAIMICVWAVARIPTLLLLRYMVEVAWASIGDAPAGGAGDVRRYAGVLTWLLSSQRIGFYICLRVSRAVVTPWARLLLGIVVKRVLLGRFTPGPRSRSQWELFRHWLAAELLPTEVIKAAAHLVGSHYEGVSVILRLLGARVGRRIYWPGSMLGKLYQYDLLEVEDDVVFGSRSIILCADRDIAAPVRICAGANVADRCVLMPGVTVGRNAILGSGTLAPRGFTFPAGSKWLGSRAGEPVKLDPGDPASAAQASTLRPFGRAMSLRRAEYGAVLPWWAHGGIHTAFQAVGVVFRALALTTALAAAAAVVEAHAAAAAAAATGVVVGGQIGGLVGGEKGDAAAAAAAAAEKALAPGWWVLWVEVVPAFVCVQNAAMLAVVAAAVAVKWAVVGRRTEGEHDWDKSPYCQRWQITLAASSAFLHGGGSLMGAGGGANGLLDHARGSAYLVWYLRALGADIGKDVCMHPLGADPLMTEPELVRIGPEACVDDAALTAHLNTQGRFVLGRIEVGPRATLRRGARVLAGATVGAGATLLEHTLALAGDAVDPGAVWQGWPAAVVADGHDGSPQW